MKKAILAFLLCSLTLVAADVTGNWSGVAQMKRADGSEGTEAAYLVLKQQANTVTGTAGGNPDRQQPIQNGKVEGDQVTFEFLPVNNNAGVKVLLKLQPDGNTMKGEVRIQRDGDTQVGQLELKREK